MFTVGLDIGYSNLKLAFGERDTGCRTILRPAGAAPREEMPERIMGGDREEIHVLVDGDPFVAGIEPDRPESWVRELHRGYPFTKTWGALFHAGLLLCESETVDRLVTGLPVDQYLDPDLRKRVRERIRGQHQVTSKRTVSVLDVRVVPQPLGGFIDHVWSLESAEDIEDWRVLVVDPGFFSVDWVVIDHADLDRSSSGTSLEASSVVLEESARLIAAEHGGNVGRERIESAVRGGKSTVRLFGQPVEIGPYLEQAASRVGPRVAASLREALRKEASACDLILLVGGGAAYFRGAIEEAFPRLPLTVSEEPVLANARGFWML
ncbi:ParM/StbA family protein [Methylococcus capsulatus]|jgi:plasmid segregation protein ParM|uniref:ParM/StbA family protein n=1 Tax=Methylococcus capsulatus TaxID=414 RepID=UPI001C52CB1A|nr:ParM/StbA family protein [Methylococcus capsulatus]QXP89533.1 ParM/StbA family protein [Methylococcus capsulatus]